MHNDFKNTNLIFLVDEKLTYANGNVNGHAVPNGIAADYLCAEKPSGLDKVVNNATQGLTSVQDILPILKTLTLITLGSIVTSVSTPKMTIS